MLAGQVSGFWSNDTPTLYGSYPSWTVRASPAFTYFVWNNVGLGAVLTGSYSRGELFGGGGFIERALGGAAECVWNVPLGGRFSLMLHSALGYLYMWSDLSVRGLPGDLGPQSALPSNVSLRSIVIQRETRHIVRASTALPIVYAFSESVGLGAGPTLTYEYVVQGTREWPTERPRDLLDSARERFRGSRLRVGVSVAVYASF